MKEEKTYSGRVLLRLPRSLHKDCVERAKEEGVSLNQFVLYAVAEKVGEKKAATESSSEAGTQPT
jgi:antitoxin HicB